MVYFKINDIDVATLGVTILKGVYTELLKLPKVKDTVTNNWPDEHGTERDLTARVYESRTLNIPVLIKGTSTIDYITKKQNFNNMLLNGRFNLKCNYLNRQFDLVYSDSTNFKSGKNYCVFEIVCFDDFPQLNTPVI